MICRMSGTLVMTGCTLTAPVIGARPAIRHSEGPAIGRLQDTIGLVTGSASVMDELIGVVNGNASRIADDTGVTTRR